MTDLSKKINDYRTQKEITLAQLAEKTGIAKSTLQRYEAGITKKIPLAAILEIESALNLPSGTLSDSIRPAANTLLPPTLTGNITHFPVIGDIAAGYDQIAVEDWTGETVEIPNSYLRGRKKEDFIVLRVKGDSMYPLYQDGDKVLILKQNTLNHSGEIGAILYGDELVTIKKIEYVPGEDWLRLIPINPQYKPQEIKGEDLEHCSVIGIPKLLIREF